MVVFAWCNQTMNYLGIVVDCPKSYKPQVLHHVVQIQPQSLRIVDKGLFGDFFTSYVDSLACGYHDIVNGAISMMPNTGPNTCTSMSHGIRTTVSVMFCTDETPRFRVYRYQVSFEIVDPENFEYKSVQLTERYWLIHYDGGRYVESGGPGVVGEFPILTKDQPYYRYCSRIQDEDDDVPVLALEGFFKWVPGTIEEPLGVEITLPVPFVEMPMPLEIL
ncbi:hypothetical protein GGI05_002868 [Coemansia sp. RSA 2603]|nr:hypothetical protein GGI05_002868 [Coemansia sp. RSA 2603]